MHPNAHNVVMVLMKVVSKAMELIYFERCANQQRYWGMWLRAGQWFDRSKISQAYTGSANTG
eukprot:6492547-Amphidinium_carterae.2